MKIYLSDLYIDGKKSDGTLMFRSQRNARRFFMSLYRDFRESYGEIDLRQTFDSLEYEFTDSEGHKLKYRLTSQETAD